MNKSIFAIVFPFLLVTQAAIVGGETPDRPAGKDPCMLNSENCPNQSLTLQDKIRRLKEEISKGTAVYTRDELRRLEDKLKDAEDMQYNILYGPSAGGPGR